MTTPYDDIIDHPHHVSKVHPQMPMISRAAQFSPFAALTGYDAAIEETSRLTDRRIELTEEEEGRINDTLAQLTLPANVSITYFVPDERKAGGRYVGEQVVVKQIVAAEGVMKLADGRSIHLSDLLEVEG